MKGLGNRIKALRKERRITLVEVARQTGIDQATLSRIENEKMLGTLDSHLRIAKALGIRLPELYNEVLLKIEESKDQHLKQKVETFFHSSGAVAELLTAGIFNKKMMPILLKLKPKGRTENEEYSSISERFVYILKGRLELVLGKEVKTLNAGQYVYFTASTPHHFRNAGTSETVCLSVLTPAAP
jgi:transcriptional regulator with XRE-family HTH domain